MTTTAQIDIEGFEAWMRDVPAGADVAAWQVEGCDLWPLLCSSVVSLGIQSWLGHRRHFVRVGGALWRSAIGASAIKRRLESLLGGSRAGGFEALGDLGGAHLLFASAVNASWVGPVYVCPPLDVAGLALRSEGQRTVTWFYDIPFGDDRLAASLNGPAVAGGALLERIARHSGHFNSRDALSRAPGFDGWLAEAARRLGFTPRFLLRWIARQADMMLAARDVFGQMFDRQGCPQSVLLAASGFAVTGGLAAASRARRIPVIEIQHGIERTSALTHAGSRVAFSGFNTAPDGFLSWSTVPSANERVLSIGPTAVHLPSLVAGAAAALEGMVERLNATMLEQRSLLAQKIAQPNCVELLISLQEEDSLAWVGALAAQMPRDTFFWIRRHPSMRHRPPPALPGLDGSRYDTALASDAALQMLLERAAVHVTEYSGVTIEAAANGVPTVATNRYAQSHFAPLIPPDLFAFAEDAPTAARKVEAFLAQRGRSSRGVAGPDLSGIAAFVERVRAR